MADSTRQMTVKFVGDTSGLKKAGQEAEAGFGNLAKGAVALGGALAAGFAASKAIDFLQGCATAAAEDAKEQAILATVLTNVTGATKAQIAANEEWITKTQNATGIMDSQLRPALQNLVVATGSVSEAQREMQVAMDISVAKGIDLESVTKAMAKAHDGNTGALAKLGIETKNTAGETLTYDEILKNANETMGGATAAAADTASGKLAIMNAKWADLQEEIGTAVLPIMEKFVDFTANSLIPGIEEIVNLLSGAPSNIGDQIANILNSIGQGFTMAINFAIDRINSAIHAAEFLNLGADFPRIDRVAWNPVVLGPDSFRRNASDEEIAAFSRYVMGQSIAAGAVAGPAVPIPKKLGPPIPGAASGGYVAGTGIAVIHKGETVVPAGGGMTVNIGTVTVADQRAFVEMLQRIDRTYGGVPINVRTPA